MPHHFYSERWPEPIPCPHLSQRDQEVHFYLLMRRAVEMEMIGRQHRDDLLSLPMYCFLLFKCTERHITYILFIGFILTTLVLNEPMFTVF
jgi:hypothetical protein